MTHITDKHDSALRRALRATSKKRGPKELSSIETDTGSKRQRRENPKYADPAVFEEDPLQLKSHSDSNTVNKQSDVPVVGSLQKPTASIG